jgi:hypothetical protein
VSAPPNSPTDADATSDLRSLVGRSLNGSLVAIVGARGVGVSDLALSGLKANVSSEETILIGNGHLPTDQILHSLDGSQATVTDLVGMPEHDSTRGWFWPDSVAGRSRFVVLDTFDELWPPLGEDTTLYERLRMLRALRSIARRNNQAVVVTARVSTEDASLAATRAAWTTHRYYESFTDAADVLITVADGESGCDSAIFLVSRATGYRLTTIPDPVGRLRRQGPPPTARGAR